MKQPRHEKSTPYAASNLGGIDSAESAHTTTHEGAEAMPLSTTIPARFDQVHDDENAIYIANQYRAQSILAEEVICPNSGNGLSPVLNLEISIEEGTTAEVRQTLEDALRWFGRIEAQLPGGSEINR